MKKLLILLFFFFGTGTASAIGYDSNVGGTIALVGTAAIGVAALVGTAPALLTLAIGAAVLGITFPPNSNVSQSPIVVQISPSAKFQTPPGWTAPNSGSQPTPPATVASSTTYTITGFVEGSITATSLALLCSQIDGKHGGGFLYSNGRVGTGNQCLATGNGSYEDFFGVSVAQGCPAGYAISGSTCNLTDTTVVKKPTDGTCGIVRAGNTFSSDTQDPDCDTISATSGLTVGTGTISAVAPDGSSSTVTINGDGTTTSVHTQPNPGSTPTTTITTTFMSAPDASGNAKVTGQSSTVGTGIGSGSGGTATTVTFDKSGLATEGTLGGIKSDTGAIKDALTDPGTADSSLGTAKTALDSATDAASALFSGETTKSSGINDDFSFGGYMPAACGCVPLSVDYKGHSASFDWCTPMDILKSVLAWAFGLLTAVHVLSLLRIGGG